ncbi:hypothetical protein [Undibacterium sp. CY21W]|uniref:hypothetical protein n=1 Tax=Undibacterium sp. CY21W TaxID=2762293 RepID=UPI00210677EA|nr:hypothetical protein [Undibacterium sp. CY21W]
MRQKKPITIQSNGHYQYYQRLFSASFFLICLCTASVNAHATPWLRCVVGYAGSTQLIETGVTNDPYSVESVDINGRFKFKAVMNGSASTINYIKLYAFFQTRSADVPIHQATYYPPFQLSKQETPFTPKNSIYAGDVERELQYQCTLEDKQP